MQPLAAKLAANSAHSQTNRRCCNIVPPGTLERAERRWRSSWKVIGSDSRQNEYNRQRSPKLPGLIVAWLPGAAGSHDRSWEKHGYRLRREAMPRLSPTFPAVFGESELQKLQQQEDNQDC
jgi:hypothetical protein